MKEKFSFKTDSVATVIRAINFYKSIVPLQLTDKVQILSHITVEHKTVTKNVVSMQPGQEKTFLLNYILDDTHNGHASH